MDPERTALVASDQHLGAAPPERSTAFLQWLEQVPDRARHLVLNGDLFDFWFEYGSVIPRGHTRVLGALANLVDAGIRIDFLGGNHDWWGGSYLRDEIGLRVHPDPVVLDLAGRRALVAHGDGLGRGDLGYRALRGILRSRIARWGFRWIHPDVGAGIARAVSRTEERSDASHPRVQERASELERWARERLLADETLDAVLLAHTHRPARVTLAPGRHYLNSGDWLEHCTWVEFAPDTDPRLMTWNGGRPEPFRARPSRGVPRED
jgi:UDP-2,3-diacylglucosamine hydrolase